MWMTRTAKEKKIRWNIIVYVTVFIALMLCMVGGIPPVPSLLRHTPLLSSMRVSPRFLFVFSVPMILAGIAGLAVAVRHMKERTGNAVAIGLTVLTVIMFYTINVRPATQVLRTMPYGQYAAMLDGINQNDGLRQPVTTLVPGFTDFTGTEKCDCMHGYYPF